MPFGKKLTDFPKIDDPSVREMYVGALGQSFFDGHSFHLELCALRLDEPNPPKQPSGNRQIIGRLVLSGEATIDLFNTCMQMAGALQQAGLITKMPDPRTKAN